MKTLIALMLMQLVTFAAAAATPAVEEGDFVVRDFRLQSGQVLPELRLHYRTLGKLQCDERRSSCNAVLILHGTGGSGAQFLRPEFADELFASGGELDASRYFIILPDGIGHGKSTKPSDGMRARFPRYGYIDMVAAQHQLVTEHLGVPRLRLVMGTSMGGMHTWLWGQRYPDLMDALLPLASLPTQISGRNRVWRRVAIDAIRNDPQWRNGEYKQQPPALRTAQEMLFLMASNPVLRQQQMGTLSQSDSVLDASVAESLKTSDANDLLYQLEASHDYDPGPGLEKIRAPLVAINFADDLINPPELGILEREIQRVPNGRALTLPAGPQSRGHGTHTVAAVWKQHLQELLAGAVSTAPSAQSAVVHQLRIYEIFEGNKRAFHDRFRDHAARIMAKYDFRIVAMWEAKTDQRTEFVYVLEWPDRETMADRWKKFMADEEWARIKKETAAVHGKLVGEIEDRTLVLTDYSPNRKLLR
jgi:homoserine O-acetyltransferase